MKQKITGFLLIFLMIACSSPTDLRPFPVVNKVKSGESLKVVLAETHRDGATWHLTDSYDKALIERQKEVWHGPDKGIYYHLKAKKAGTTELVFLKRHYVDTLERVTFIIAIVP